MCTVICALPNLITQSSKWNLRNNNIETNNSEDFQKVIIDHTSVVRHITVRGLTKCGTIVNFKTNTHSDFFHGLEMDEDNVEYNESLSVINMFSDCMNSFCNIWESETKQNVQTLGSIFNTKQVA